MGSESLLPFLNRCNQKGEGGLRYHRRRSSLPLIVQKLPVQQPNEKKEKIITKCFGLVRNKSLLWCLCSVAKTFLEIYSSHWKANWKCSMVMSECCLKLTSWPPPRSGLALPCTHPRREWLSRTSTNGVQICKNNELLPGAMLIPQATAPPIPACSSHQARKVGPPALLY